MTLDELDALREGWDFEAKLAAGRDGRGALPASFWETYVAMANTSGGRIALGVREQPDGSLVAAGVLDPDRVERELWSLLNNPQKVSANLLVAASVRRESIDGATIIVIDVPRASRRVRPVHLGPDPFAGTYLRHHEADHRVVDRERVRRMIAESVHDSRDDRVLERFGPADLAAESLAAYCNRFRNNKPAHPWSELDDLALLHRLGGFGRDRESGAEGLTIAGLLMFGRAEAICEVLPHYFVDYQERVAGTGAIEWSDRIYPDGVWSGNVFDFYRKAVLRLTADVKVPFQLGPDLYRRDETHVHEALREALVNMLIHADYEGRSPLLVVKAPGSFMFRNPGTPRLAIEQIREGGHSDCRNPTLQKMFLLQGIGEKAGSGFSRIDRAWREERWAPPTLREDPELDTTTLVLSTASLVRGDVQEALSAQFGPGVSRLPPTALLALALAKTHGSVTHDDLRAVAEGHSRDLTLTLARLVDQGRLVRVGFGRPARYSLPSIPPNIPPSIPPSMPPNMPRSGMPGRATTGDSAPARPHGSRRNRQGNIAAILEFCTPQARTATEIAEHIGFSAKTIRDRYLQQLVDARALAMSHPESPRHPAQSYRTALGGDATDGPP